MKKLFSKIASFQSILAGILLIALVITVLTQIFGRSIMKWPVLWTEELARYLLIWITFIGAVNVIIKGESLCVDFLKVRYSNKQLQFLNLLTHIVMLFFSGFLCYFGILLCQAPTIVRSKTPVMLMPKWILYVILPLTMSIAALHSAYGIFTTIRILIKGETEEKAENDKHNIEE